MHRPLAIGIVGLNFGRHIVKRLSALPAATFFRIGAVCDKDLSKAKELSRLLNVPAYANLDDLLNDSQISVVGLFTAPVGRADLLRTIIRAGKDVMTTKPFELNPEAARSVLAEAQQLGRIIHLNSPGPLPSPAVSKIQEWEHEYDLGRPVYCMGEATASYRETSDGSWYDDPSRCPAAPILRIGVYLLNDFVRLFGGVSTIQVRTARLLTERPTPDSALATLQFDNRMLGSVHASFCVDNGQSYANSFRIHYERGTIQQNMGFYPYGRASVSTNLSLCRISQGQTVATEEYSFSDNTGSYQWKEFYEAVISRDIGTIPVEDIIRSVELLDALVRADQNNEIAFVSKKSTGQSKG